MARRLAGLAALTAICLGVACGCGKSAATRAAETRFTPSDYASVMAGVSADRMGEDIRYFASLGSRLTGYPGADKAAQYVERQFRGAGIQNIEYQDFEIMVPVDHGSTLIVDGEPIPIHAVWPNVVRTSQVAPGTLRGPVVYGADCSLGRFDGAAMDGAIVLADFNCGTNWLNVPLLGGRAVVFVEPRDTTWSDAAEKYLKVPVDVPRFYIEREQADPLLARLKAAQGSSAPSGGIECRMTWERRKGRNIIATLPGSDPELSAEHIFLEAYYDSISVVPNRAPGADQASSIAALMELARLLAAAPPKRTVVLAACSGHFEAMRGAHRLGDVLGPKGRRPREQDQFLRDGIRERNDTLRWLRRSAQRAAQRRDFLEAERKAGKFELTARGDIDWDAALALTQDRIDLVSQELALVRKYRDRQTVAAIPLWLSLDLSSHSRRLGLNHCGWYYNRGDLIRFFSPIGKRMGEYLEGASKALGYEKPDLFWFDGTNPKQNVSWPDYFPGRIAFDSEAPLQAGRPACVLATGYDQRPYFNTPLDTVERMDMDGLTFQTRVIACILSDFLNDSALTETALKRTHRLKLPYRLEPLRGNVLEFVHKKSFLPDTPVPGCLTLIAGPFKSMMGVHNDVMDLTDGSGAFSIQGYNAIGWGNVDAYYIDPVSGDVIYAPDLGSEGEKRYTRNVGKRGRQIRPVIVFPCRPIDFYDLVDQRYLETLEQLFVYDARTDSEPLSFGYALPQFNPPAGELGVPVEPCATLFCDPTKSVKLAMGMGIFRARLVLLNGSPEKPMGIGFNPLENPRIPLTLHRAAWDVWHLDEVRMKTFRARGVEDPRLNTLHRAAQAELKAADEAREARQWGAVLSHARAGWAFESNAYPDVLKSARDVVSGALFYLALLMSFAYFVERLLISASSVQGRVGWTFGIFLVIFVALMNVHPAFSLAINPYIILLAFIVLALGLIVTSIVVTKFNEQLEQLKQEVGGIHKADVGRMGAASLAFALGVANMRRRKMRTALTCVTLILLTFTVLSFTSVSSGTKINRIRRAGTPAYYGFMIRDKVWAPLEDSIPAIIDNEFGQTYPVAPRGWVVSGDIAKKAYLTVFSARDPATEFTVNSILGLSPNERNITDLPKALLPGGKWFEETDGNVCILPQSVAEGLKINPDEVARWNQRVPERRPGQTDAEYFSSGPFIQFSGTNFRVVGILPDDAIDKFKDLDGETLAPVNYADMKPEIIAQIREMAQQRFKLGRTGVESLLQDYKHFTARELFILPYERLLRVGGTTRSVIMGVRDYAVEQDLIKSFMDRFAISMYAGEVAHGDEPAKVMLYSSIGRQRLDGLETVIIPILIAAMIVLNTMLGAVYERIGEIHIFSAVGLNPTHIGTLFLAESCVYANIGAIVGYLMGQILAKVLFLTGNIEGSGISLNYSSKAAVASTMVVVATVLLSTLWPARRAAEISVPDVDRKWKLPEPDGDNLVLPMPFTVTGLNGRAANMFLVEFFEAYVGYAGGDFYTEGVSFSTIECEHGEGYVVELLMWLAPYDLGVSQHLRIVTEPTGEMNVYAITLHMHREAGDISSWKKTNWLFLNVFRKQLLIWRTLTPEQREVYAERATEYLSREAETVTA